MTRSISQELRRAAERVARGVGIGLAVAQLSNRAYLYFCAMLPTVSPDDAWYWPAVVRWAAAGSADAHLDLYSASMVAEAEGL